MAKFTIVVPLADGHHPAPTPVKDSPDLPYTGGAQRFILDETEFKPWLEMFLADTTLGSRFYLERH